MQELIATIDIGKTNARLSFIDAQSATEVWSARRANEIVDTQRLRQLDIAGIEGWLIRTLRDAPQTAQVTAIVPIAHGATAVLLDDSGQVLAAPDYEDAAFESVSAAYERERDPFDATCSPSLPLGLNLARQFFYLEQCEPQLFARAAHILLYPQYWAWKLSGVMASEVTSLGCHTDLWRPGEALFSRLATTHGWNGLLAAGRFAGDTLGTVTPQMAAVTGLNPDCRVVCGIHDSNASWLQYLIDQPREQSFTVVSSGTWTVVMASHGDLSLLRAERDMLANVDAFGSPVCTARFMGGREYAAIAPGNVLPDAASVMSVIGKQSFALPGFANGGPFKSVRGSIRGAMELIEIERAALATLYVALMTDLLIDSVAGSGDIFIDGPLASNPLFAPLLATWRPANRVFVSTGNGSCHRAACYLAGFRSTPASARVAITPFAQSQYHDYRLAWRGLLPAV